MNQRQFCGRTRREFLWELGGGFGSVALTGLLSGDGFFNPASAAEKFVNPLAPKKPMFPAKAKSVIFIFCYGGPSHVDTFEHKPKLYPLDGKTIPVKTFGRGGHKNEGRVVGPKWAFKPYGKCGKMVSDLFPNIGSCVDDIAFVHSMYAESPIHGSAMLMMNSGRILSGHPALGSWVTYGLGSENDNFPGFVVMLDHKGGPISGAKNWSSGYMPAAYQATVIRADATPIHDLAPPPGTTRDAQRLLLDRLREKNQEHHADGRMDNSELAARIASYELAFKMQQHAPEAVDFAKESKETLELYGIPEKRTEDFGRKCLLARRLVERGVRFIQIYSGGAHNDDNWDAALEHRDQSHQACRQYRQADRGINQGPEASRAARLHAYRLGRRVRPPADGRVRSGNWPRSQCLRLHDVAGWWRHQRRRERRRDRRTRLRGRQGSLPREEFARHGIDSAGAGSESSQLLLWRSRPEVGRRRRGRADQADHLRRPA